MANSSIEHVSIDHVSVGVLGLVTICAYGSWYYAFGVLLDPILVDTGWSESALTASFSVGTVLIGIAALFGGRLLDRVGHRPVFSLGALIATAGLLTASWATSLPVFFASAAIGLAACGSLGFYHITMTTVVRLNPNSAAGAIAVLTIWGALASAIFLPGASWLESTLGWRGAVRVLALATAAAFALAAVVLPSTAPPAEVDHKAQPSIAAILRSTVAEPAPRLFTIAVACGGLAMQTMLVYQVTVMIAAGLGAGLAASMAGLRGLCQLGGRLPLTPLVNWLGRDGALILAFAAMTAGAGLLLVAGSLPIAVVFALVAGFGIGAFSPLQGMKAEELFPREQLGATMGAYGSVLLLAGSTGPFVAGWIADSTGERRWAAVIALGAALAAMGATILLARITPANVAKSTTSVA